MNWRNVVDVSPFFLVEDSGDSEADFDPQKTCHDVDIAGIDDAESCSSDSSYTLEKNDVDEQDYSASNDGEGDCGHDYKEPSCRSSRKKLLSDDASECISTEEGEDEETRVGVCESREVMDEMEDSLFWETCLAVGYPRN
ncbi:hypothetical protein L1049_017683 [Liquidambar formosana]|uniref:Uncharacterized protein n=1 Tax=Liquidambar formosana TaxID=63359 RepID=A0AAP0X1F4_LIQFO